MLSAMLTFKLTNTYLTNLVKCGLSNKEDKFKRIGHYNDECIENCYKNILYKEIELVDPLVIFTVGSAVEGWVRYLTKDSHFIQHLPHPAGRRRGFRDEHFKVLFFWLVLRTLYKAGIIEMEESKELTDLFLKKFE